MSPLRDTSPEDEEPPNGPAPKRFRTATDYDNELCLRAALTEPPWRGDLPPDTIKVGPCTMDANLSTICCDWQIAKLDLSTSVGPQSMEGEVKRLMELRAYGILDAEHEEKFERITALASRIFDVPICLVSLVDLGRQWFMSNRGLGDARETSREVSFCAHAILSKQEVFIVPDTYEDPRFKENGLVTGGPFIRFYAGVPLVTPGGHKLGTFCIIDRKPRPGGLCLKEKQNLRELAEMVMDTMVHRKQEMEGVMDEKTRLIACAAHDLLSPLTGIQLNLGLLMEDETLKEKLDANQKELMEACVNCSDVIERICLNAIESFRGDLTKATSEEGDASSVSDTDTDVAPSNRDKGIVNIDQLVESIQRVIGTYPKKVPFFVEKDDNVPREIIGDDLKLFRSILNYLTNACKHTHGGLIRLRLYARKASEKASSTELELLPGALVAPMQDALVIEVHDTGPGIHLKKYPSLFTPLENIENGTNANHSSRMTNSGLGLYSVATEISSLGGEYGVFPRQDLVACHPDHDSSEMDISETNGHHELNVTGCVFWFSVPLLLPKSASPAPALAPAMRRSSSHMNVRMMESLELNKMVTDGSKLMPAPRKATPCKRPFVADDTAGAAKDHNSPSNHMPKKLAVSDTVSGNKRGRETMSETKQPSSDVTTKNQTDAPPDTDKRTKRVLIIDDSVTIRKGLARGFSRLGFEVDQAENGLQGFKKLKADMYDICLCDFLMPVMDGPDVARKFRAWETEHRPDFRQFIIGISAHANGKDAELGIKAGMDRFMGKPVPLKSLKDLAQSKRVEEASILLDKRFKSDCLAMEEASRLAESRSDEGGSKSSRSALSSNSTFTKHSCLIVTRNSEPALQRLVRIVEKNGWRAVVAKQGDGEDALRLLKLRKWDAVFIDNDLPILSGTNCLARFRDWENHTYSRNHQQNVFIISDSYNNTTMPAGFDGVLMKPVDPGQVRQILEGASFKFNCTNAVYVHR